jgi:hypothetical protein
MFQLYRIGIKSNPFLWIPHLVLDLSDYVPSDVSHASQLSLGKLWCTTRKGTIQSYLEGIYEFGEALGKGIPNIKGIG